MISHGTISAWITPALPHLMSKDSPALITGPLTNEEISWIASIASVGSLFGTFTFSCFISLMGCKRTSLFLALPYLLFWLFVYFGSTYNELLFARFFSGWASGGIQTAVVLYTSEISNDE